MMRRRSIVKQPNNAHNPPKRNFYAATAKHLKPIPARVSRTEHGTWELETYERHQEQETVRVAVDAGKPISRKNMLYTWESKFHIDPKNGTIVRDKNTFLSSKYILGSRQSSLFIPWQEDKYFPDLLYGIPQITWNEFIARLPHPYIVAKLNLSVHRHVWKSYNFVATTEGETLRNRRLEALSTYHFLYQPYMDSSRIDVGLSTLETLNKLGYSAQLANKLAHCYSSHHALLLKHYVQTKATVRELNKEKYDEIVAAMPSSQTAPVEFAKMLDDALAIDVTILQPEAKANFFYHARNHFGHFRSVKFSSHEFKDYINSIVRDLIFPDYLRSLESAAADSPRDQIALEERERTLKNQLQLMLTEMYTPKRLQELVSRWHRNISVIESKKPLEVVSPNWHALFERQTIDNISFECLTTAEALYQEGNELRHCVGGYRKDCRTGGTHIVRIQSLTGERSTLSITPEVENGKTVFKIDQHYGIQNSDADALHVMAVDKLMQMLNKGEIKINKSMGAITRGDIKLSLAHLFYPYDLKDPSVQEQIYQAYRKLKVLPPLLVAESYDEMLTKFTLHREKESLNCRQAPHR